MGRGMWLILHMVPPTPAFCVLTRVLCFRSSLMQAGDLVDTLIQQNVIFKGRRVLELGCGAALPGIYAAVAGAGSC